VLFVMFTFIHRCRVWGSPLGSHKAHSWTRTTMDRSGFQLQRSTSFSSRRKYSVATTTRTSFHVTAMRSENKKKLLLVSLYRWRF